MEIKRTMRGRRAFTWVELLVLIAGLALLAAILLPALATAKRKSARVGCINNLKQEVIAFKMWANDNDGKYPMQVSVTNDGAMELAEKGIAFPIFQVMSNELASPKILICPEDKKHTGTFNFVDFGNTNISYFVGLDAHEDMPGSVLSGDDNLTVNGKPVSSGVLNLTPNNVVEWTDERRDRFHGWGNTAFTDGSVSQMSNGNLRNLIETSAATNRLVIP